MDALPDRLACFSRLALTVDRSRHQPTPCLTPLFDQHHVSLYAVMDISKVCSAPLDPTAPSLLTLPAEIRNRINEYVFIRPEPILIHDADFYYNQGRYGCEIDGHRYCEGGAFDSEEQRYFAGKRCRKSLREWETRSDAEKEDALLFRNEALLGIGLLKSCRQMYHETVGVLYSENTFVVSRVRDRVLPGSRKTCEIGDRRAYHQVSYTPKWLASLGSQVRRLKKVVIDVSGFPYAYVESTPDWLPLLRAIWDGVLMRCVISFAHIGRRTDFDRSRVRDLTRYATRLNETFDLLVRDNTLHVRRYPISRSIVSSLTVEEPGHWGCVEFYTGSRRTSRLFKIGKESGDMVWHDSEKFESLESLMQLPIQVRDIICRHLFANEPRLRIIMNSLNPLGCHRAVFDVSQKFRRGLVKAVAACIPITVELEASPADMDYNALDPFRRYSLIPRDQLKRDLYHNKMTYLPDRLRSRNLSLDSQIISASVEDRSCKEQNNGKTTLLIRVPLVRPAKPTDICINISPVLSWLEGIGHKNCRDDVPLVIQLEHTNGRELHYETNSTTIGQLKMRIFLYFTDMLNRRSREEESGPELQELWIDGHANLVDLASPLMGFRFSRMDFMKAKFGKGDIKGVLENIEARHSLDVAYNEDLVEDCVWYGSYPCMCHSWRSLRQWAESVWRREQWRIEEDEQNPV